MPPGSITPFALAPPNLIISYTDANNHPQGVYYAGTANAPNQRANGGSLILTGISAQTNLEQGIYSWPMAEYCAGRD
ncbi:MAG: hypothetical protein WKG07_42090 [Hymenobacter sp.]